MCIEQIASLLIFSFTLNGMKTYGPYITGGCKPLYTLYMQASSCARASHPYTHTENEREWRGKNTLNESHFILYHSVSLKNHRYIVSRRLSRAPNICVQANVTAHTQLPHQKIQRKPK